MKPEETFTYDSVDLWGATWEGQYIDDHIIVQVVKKLGRARNNHNRDSEIVRDSRAAYVKRNLPRSIEKGFVREPDFIAWGSAVSNRSGRVGSPLEKLALISSVTLDFHSVQLVSKKMMQQLGYKQKNQQSHNQTNQHLKTSQTQGLEYSQL